MKPRRCKFVGGVSRWEGGGGGWTLWGSNLTMVKGGGS